MQCLFCGKELALLKRLRGGAEFCSEAHRKDYQEQFEQLALARLIQAKPPTGPVAPLGRPSVTQLIPSDVPDPVSDPTLDSAIYEAEAPSSAWAEPQVDAGPVSSWQQSAEEPAPAPLAGFLSEPVVPAVTPFQYTGVLELNNEMAAMSLPAADWTGSTASEPFRSPAPPVEIVVSLQALEHHTRTSERGMELREFPGTVPIMELHLRPDSGTAPAGADDVMEILMSPHPPQTAKFWLGAPRGFSAAPAELGNLARLDFTTTGFAHSDAAVRPESPAPVGPALISSTPQSTVLTLEPPARLEPQLASAPPAPVVQAPVVQAPLESAPPVLVTKALPVTLHGLAALRGKLVETFPSGIASASGVQIPTSATLPLRPTIVFGPAPASARAPEAAAPPAQVQPKVQVQPKQVQTSPVQTSPVQTRPVPEKAVEAKTQERVRPSVVPAPKPVPVKRPVAPVVHSRMNPTVNPRVDSPVEPRRDTVAASEAALPTLHLETESSAWSKLSTGVKIGVAAALLVGLSGIAYLVTKGNGKTANNAPVATVAAPAVATGVSISGGWIDDWATFAKSRRHISVLSGSAKLSDYRLEFQSQIESKAIGWVSRAQNPRNYYVTKLETIKAGLEPTVALVHFAVVDGQDENPVVVPLPMKVRVDTTYKIRFDAFGNRFAAWVQGEKIAEWTDSRFGSGGVGFFSERDEHAALQGNVNVVALVPKN